MSASSRQESLTRSPAGSEHREGFRAVGVAVSKLARPVVGKRGGGLLVRLKSDWPTIAGAEWALVTWPAALGRDGALKLRTAPAAALELQHRAPLLIERVNLFFGRPAVSRLVLVQGPLPGPAAPPTPPPRPLAAAVADALDQGLGTIDDLELRDALSRLGRAVIGAG